MARTSLMSSTRIFALAALTSLALPLTAIAADEVGQVTRVANYAYQTPEGSDRAPAYERDPVYHNAEVEAVQDGGAELTFLDGSKLTVGPSSSVVIDDFVYDPSANAGEAAVRLTKGMLRFVSGAMPDDKVKIETETVTIGIRGTIVKAGILPDGVTIVSCVEGLCTVTSKSTGQTIEIPASHFIKVGAGGDLTPIEFGNWEFGEIAIDEGLLFQNSSPSNDLNGSPPVPDND